jgi:hypothetical protein
MIAREKIILKQSNRMVSLRLCDIIGPTPVGRRSEPLRSHYKTGLTYIATKSKKKGVKLFS